MLQRRGRRRRRKRKTILILIRLAVGTNKNTNSNTCFILPLPAAIVQPISIINNRIQIQIRVWSSITNNVNTATTRTTPRKNRFDLQWQEYTTTTTTACCMISYLFIWHPQHNEWNDKYRPTNTSTHKKSSRWQWWRRRKT